MRISLKEIPRALFAFPQYALPHHPLSRLMQRFAHSQNKYWKNFLIRCFINFYGVNMAEAEKSSLDAYPSFNAFFTRALKKEARPLPEDTAMIVCPADGTLSQIGAIQGEQIFQAKGKHYSLIALLGGDRHRAEPFQKGRFATIYLSPRDYHRFHMPLTGTLKEMIHIPGRLFSVNAATTAFIPQLFTRNERVIALFDTSIGPMAVVMVGAIFVASIETVWHGVVTPPTARTIRTWQYQINQPTLERGAEMGRFSMGSTIILLFGKERMDWLRGFTAGSKVQMGQALGRWIISSSVP